MCGIFGFTGIPESDNLRAMARALSHRGPDERGLWESGNVSLGATRLSLVDLASGSQPVTNARGDIHAVLNGEIYNALALRRELEAKGHVFRSRHSDSELVPHLYEAYGADFLTRLEGMFALAIWDDRRQELFLARDAVGIKPLYLSLTQGKLLFASEIKAILAHSVTVKEPNFPALHHYFSFKHIPRPFTAFRGIEPLGPGECAIFRRGQLTRQTWWRFQIREEVGWDETRAIPLLREHLRQSVTAQLQADVEVGAFLSGGLDSSAVVALAPRPLKTFTLVYADALAGKDADRESARRVAKQFHCDHHEVEMTAARLIEEIASVTEAFDEPFSGSLSTYFLARAAAREVKAVVTGDGADELFGSYLSHRSAGPRTDEVAWRMGLYLRDESRKDSFYTPRMREAIAGANTAELVSRSLDGCTSRDPLNRMLYLDFTTLLPDQVLTFSDRLAMAHSLETRPPFLSQSILDLASRLPASLKIKHGRTKHLLKECVAGILPQDLIDRPKEGFILPLRAWMAASPELRDFTSSVLMPERFGKSGLFDAVLSTETEENWNLVMFQLWWEKHFG